MGVGGVGGVNFRMLILTLHINVGLFSYKSMPKGFNPCVEGKIYPQENAANVAQIHCLGFGSHTDGSNSLQLICRAVPLSNKINKYE